MKKKVDLRVVAEVVVALLLGFLFCLKFSLATSPLYGLSLHAHDSAIFSIIGKYWAEGAVPYVELWDHKGPVIFFVNCIGYLLSGDNWLGLFFIQFLSVGTFTLFVYKTFRLRFNETVSWALSVIALFWLACSYEGGNMTEEYLLPFLSAAFYNLLKWIDAYEKERCDHSPWNAFLLGFILSFSFLTRLTNALGACGAMFAIGLVLLRDKRWKNLLQNVLAYVCGFLVLFLPFALYFLSKGAFQDFVFGSFTYNVSNMKATAGGLHNPYWVKYILPFSIMAVNCFGLAFVSAYMFFSNRDHRVGALVWLCATLFLSSWLFRSSLMSHYRTVALPFFPVLVLELFRLKRGFHPVLRYGLLALLAIGPVFITLRKWNSFTDYYDRPYAVEIAKDVQDDVPQEALARMAVYDDPQVYLVLGIKPVYRNFSFPGTQGRKNDRLKEDILSEYGSCQAEYILTRGETSLIQAILDASYDYVKTYPESGNYRLWKRRDIDG